MRLVKYPNEPIDNKEHAILCLFNIMNGDKRMFNAAVSPATDTISGLVKCMSMLTRKKDTRNYGRLAELIRSSFEFFLIHADPKQLR